MYSLWAAKKVGRPVKWVPDRSDAFMTDTQGRDNVTGSSWPWTKRSGPGAGGYADRQYGRLFVELRARDPDRFRRGDAQRRLCDPGDSCRRQGRIHEYRAGGRLSRRRSARGGTMPSNGWSTMPRAASVYRRRSCGGAILSSPTRCRTRRRSASTTTAANLRATWTRRLPRPISRASQSGAPRDELRGRFRGIGHAVYIEQSGFPPTNSPSCVSTRAAR